MLLTLNAVYPLPLSAAREIMHIQLNPTGKLARSHDADWKIQLGGNTDIDTRDQ